MSTMITLWNQAKIIHSKKDDHSVYSMSKVVSKIRNKVKATRNEILHKRYHINTQ